MIAAQLHDTLQAVTLQTKRNLQAQVKELEGKVGSSRIVAKQLRKLESRPPDRTTAQKETPDSSENAKDADINDERTMAGSAKAPTVKCKRAGRASGGMRCCDDEQGLKLSTETKHALEQLVPASPEVWSIVLDKGQNPFAKKQKVIGEGTKVESTSHIDLWFMADPLKRKDGQRLCSQSLMHYNLATQEAEEVNGMNVSSSEMNEYGERGGIMDFALDFDETAPEGEQLLAYFLTNSRTYVQMKRYEDWCENQTSAEIVAYYISTVNYTAKELWRKEITLNTDAFKPKSCGGGLGAYGKAELVCDTVTTTLAVNKKHLLLQNNELSVYSIPKRGQAPQWLRSIELKSTVPAQKRLTYGHAYKFYPQNIAPPSSNDKEMITTNICYDRGPSRRVHLMQAGLRLICGQVVAAQLDSEKAWSMTGFGDIYQINLASGEALKILKMPCDTYDRQNPCSLANTGLAVNEINQGNTQILAPAVGTNQLSSFVIAFNAEEALQLRNNLGVRNDSMASLLNSPSITTVMSFMRDNIFYRRWSINLRLTTHNGRVYVGPVRVGGPEGQTLQLQMSDSGRVKLSCQAMNQVLGSGLGTWTTPAKHPGTFVSAKPFELKLRPSSRSTSYNVRWRFRLYKGVMPLSCSAGGSDCRQMEKTVTCSQFIGSGPTSAKEAGSLEACCTQKRLLPVVGQPAELEGQAQIDFKLGESLENQVPSRKSPEKTKIFEDGARLGEVKSPTPWQWPTAQLKNLMPNINSLNYPVAGAGMLQKNDPAIKDGVGDAVRFASNTFDNYILDYLNANGLSTVTTTNNSKVGVWIADRSLCIRGAQPNWRFNVYHTLPLASYACNEKANAAKQSRIVYVDAYSQHAVTVLNSTEDDVYQDVATTTIGERTLLFILRTSSHMVGEVMNNRQRMLDQSTGKKLPNSIPCFTFYLDFRTVLSTGESSFTMTTSNATLKVGKSCVTPSVAADRVSVFVLTDKGLAVYSHDQKQTFKTNTSVAEMFERRQDFPFGGGDNNKWPSNRVNRQGGQVTLQLNYTDGTAIHAYFSSTQGHLLRFDIQSQQVKVLQASKSNRD